MNGISSKTIRIAGCALLLAGCRNIQYPSLAPSQVAAERQGFAYHDPSADVEAGPWVERPRGFERPRSTPRRVDERRAITDEIVRGSEGVSSTNPAASNYPNSVNP